MADISKITLPTGTTYNLKDTVARESIGALSGAVKYLGVTTTELTDGATTSPITIEGKSITPKAGDVVIYGENEFIWSDTGECDKFYISTWTKHKVLTDADIDIADSEYYIKRYVY